MNATLLGAAVDVNVYGMPASRSLVSSRERQRAHSYVLSQGVSWSVSRGSFALYTWSTCGTKTVF